MFEASVISTAQAERRRVLCESLRVRLPRSSVPRPTTYAGVQSERDVVAGGRLFPEAADSRCGPWSARPVAVRAAE